MDSGRNVIRCKEGEQIEKKETEKKREGDRHAAFQPVALVGVRDQSPHEDGHRVVLSFLTLNSEYKPQNSFPFFFLNPFLMR